MYFIHGMYKDLNIFIILMMKERNKMLEQDPAATEEAASFGGKREV